MPGLSDYGEALILNCLLRATNITAPTTVYLALFTSDPTDANDTANEVSDSAYARQSCAFNAPHATEGYSANTSEVSFPAIVDGTITVGWVGIYDALTGGNLLYSQSVGSSKELEAGDVAAFGAAGLKVTHT